MLLGLGIGKWCGELSGHLLWLRDREDLKGIDPTGE